MQVKIVSNMNGAPEGNLADAELHFEEGLLAGLKLVGFSVWERRGARGRSVMFPARPYAVNGERRHFTLLRAVEDVAATEPLRERILHAFAGATTKNGCRPPLLHTVTASRVPPVRCQADTCSARSSYSARLLRNAGTSIDSLDVGSPPAEPGSSSTGRRSTLSAATGSAGSGCRQLS